MKLDTEIEGTILKNLLCRYQEMMSILRMQSVEFVGVMLLKAPYHVIAISLVSTVVLQSRFIYDYSKSFNRPKLTQKFDMGTILCG
jgi:hypothetical protein